MRFSASVALSALATAVSADNLLGFNSGSTTDDGSGKFKADFVSEFNTAKNLVGAPGDFTAFRLYTNIQAYSTNTPIEAFEAAMETGTKLLLGVWASGVDNIDNEMTALQTAVDNYGTKFTDLVVAISIGSEDIYRDGATSMANGGGIGASPDTILGFIKDFRAKFASTSLSDIQVGHVDTWDAWSNSSAAEVISACDFIGVNEFPYYETGEGNDIDNGASLFKRAYETVLGVSGGTPVWVTETGWPYTGPTWDQAVSSVSNAKQYWDDVGCDMLFGKVNTFWYTLEDANPDNTMKFAITDNLSTKARFDLSCPKSSSTSSSKTESATKTSTGGSSATASATTTSKGSSETTTTGSATGTAITSGEATQTGSSTSGQTQTLSSSPTMSGSATQTDSMTTEPTASSTGGNSGSPSPTTTGSGSNQSSSSTPAASSSTVPEGAAATMGLSGAHYVALAAAGVAAYAL